MTKFTSLSVLLTISMSLAGPSLTRASSNMMHVRHNGMQLNARQELGPDGLPLTPDGGPTVTSTMTIDPATASESISLPPGETAAVPPDTPPAETPAQPGDGQTFTEAERFVGKDFLDAGKWTFFTDPDPTHGVTNYVAQEVAETKKLVVVDDAAGVFTLGVDDQGPVTEVSVPDPEDPTKTKTMSLRDSVRLHSAKAYSHGLFIADFLAMPYGCSTWPAWWTHGPNWPYGGEIDLLEGVHNSPTNQYTLHTGPGCSSDPGVKDQMLGTFGRLTDCNVAEKEDNSGCSILDGDPRSYGEGFNSAGGGVIAHRVNKDGIMIWRFARDEIPAEIKEKSKTLNPATWGKPIAFFPDTTCPTAEHVRDHNLIINIAICGDWATPTHNEAGCPGVCEEMIKDPANYKNAKWKVNYIAVYQ